MRVVLVTSFLLAMSLRVWAQDERTTVFPPDSVLWVEANELLNSYKSTVARTAECKQAKPYRYERFLKKFTADAIIEVSSVNSKEKKKRKPEEYFRNLSRLCLALNYDKVKFDYTPGAIPFAQIRQTPTEYYIDVNFNQKFEAFQKGERVYCDVVIRRIYIGFYIESGTYKAKIRRVTIEDTKSCTDNEANKPF